MFKAFLWLIAASQLVLAVLVTFLPGPFLIWMGLSAPPADTGYMLAMLGARFLAYGIGMGALARAARPDRFWLANMALIQAVDFAAGAAYLATGTVTVAVVAFPMVNAALFCTGLVVWLWRDGARPLAPHPASA